MLSVLLRYTDSDCPFWYLQTLLNIKYFHVKSSIFFSAVPVMMFLIKVIKPRSVLMIGSIITAVGYSMSSLAPNIHFLFFSISFVVGGYDVWRYFIVFILPCI